ncbi:hypothetical protein J0H58_07690, partial [bacterium]|nr:hypothetical protein [bacterium]
MSTRSAADTAAPEATRAGGLNARVVAHAVRRRPLAVAGIALLAGAVAVGVGSFLPLPKATAAVVFHIATNTPSLLAPTAEGRVDFTAYKQTQAAMVKRRLTIVNALKDTGMNLETFRTAEPDPVTWLESKIKADTKPGSEFMQVTLEGNHKEELQAILGAVAKAYLKEVDERENGQRRARLAKLEEAQRAHLQDLDRFHKRTETIALALGSRDGATLATFDTINQEELRTAHREYVTARDQKDLADLELAALSAQKGGGLVPVPDALIEAELRRDPTFLQFEGAVARAQQALTETQALFEKDASPRPVVQARDAVKAAEEKRDQYRTANRARVEAQVREALSRADDARRAELQQTSDRSQKKAEVTQARVKAAQERISQGSQYRIELENLRRQSEQAEKLSNRLADEVAQIKVELGAPARVTLAEEAFVVPGIEGNRRMKYA